MKNIPSNIRGKKKGVYSNAEFRGLIDIVAEHDPTKSQLYTELFNLYKGYHELRLIYSETKIKKLFPETTSNYPHAFNKVKMKLMLLGENSEIIDKWIENKWRDYLIIHLWKT